MLTIQRWGMLQVLTEFDTGLHDLALLLAVSIDGARF